MTEKERLADILQRLGIVDYCDRRSGCEDCVHFNDPDGCIRYCAELTAEKLIKNGVRFGGWISVDDGPPTPDMQVFVAADEKGEVAYWMPIPPLPDGYFLKW